MVFRADIIASARTPESRRTPLESYAAKGILKSSPGKGRSISAARRPPVETDTGGRDRCLWSSHRSAARWRVGIYSTARCRAQVEITHNFNDERRARERIFGKP